MFKLKLKRKKNTLTWPEIMLQLSFTQHFLNEPVVWSFFSTHESEQ
jgi:hypothetical protein